MNNHLLGRQAELEAVSYLSAKGYKIIARNYKTKLGEIDIIAKDRDVFCFLEVKSRRNAKFGLPEEAVHKKKQKQIIKTAMTFVTDNRLMDSRLRFDVLSIAYSAGKPVIRLIKDAFLLEEHGCYV